MSDFTHNGLFYLALAFIPMLGVRLALYRWVRGAQLTHQMTHRVWLAFAIATVAWVVVVFEVMMPLGFGRTPFWQ